MSKNKIRGSLADSLAMNAEIPIQVVFYVNQLEKQYDDLFALAEDASFFGESGDLAHIKMVNFLAAQKKRFTEEN